MLMFDFPWWKSWALRWCFRALWFSFLAASIILVAILGGFLVGVAFSWFL